MKRRFNRAASTALVVITACVVTALALTSAAHADEPPPENTLAPDMAAPANDMAPPVPAADMTPPSTIAPTPAPMLTPDTATPSPTPTPAVKQEPAPEPRTGYDRLHPAPAEIAVGPYDAYRPLATYDFNKFRIQIPLMLNGRAETVSNFLVDRYGGWYHSGAVLSAQLRLGAIFETTKPLAGKFMIYAEYEHDLPTGYWSSSQPIDGTFMPNAEPITTQLRKAYARFSIGRYLHIGGGFMTSNFGMGLLANDGAHRWEPGSARFVDPRDGNLVLRGFIGTGPLTRARILGFIGFDQVRKDDILLPGDSAVQLVASALAGVGTANEGGIFYVYRWQKSPDGHKLDVSAIDLTEKSTIKLKRGVLTLESEVAIVDGTTTLAPNTDFSRHQVLQVGAAARANLAFGLAGGVLDLLYASGDQNFNDGRVSAFKADHNYETGLLLFRYIEAAQTARGAVTAADPMLVGQPSQNLERVPTRGGVTNAVVLFPRFWVRPLAGLEAYGGPLFAFAPVKNVDPLNTNLAGGAPRNALNADPGGYWGTEIDLGVRYRMLIHGTELTLGSEGGILFPGSALRGSNGLNMDRVLGGRLMLTYRL